MMSRFGQYDRNPQSAIRNIMIPPCPPSTGKVALVLGGCGEVGEGITRALLAAGAIVAVSSRDNNRLSELHDRLPVEWDGQYVADSRRCRFARPASLAVRDRVQFVCQRLDIVVASLGGWWKKGPLIFSTLEDWNRVLANNLTPHYLAATALVPAINKRPGQLVRVHHRRRGGRAGAELGLDVGGGTRRADVDACARVGAPPRADSHQRAGAGHADHQPLPTRGRRRLADVRGSRSVRRVAGSDRSSTRGQIIRFNHEPS